MTAVPSSRTTERTCWAGAALLTLTAFIPKACEKWGWKGFPVSILGPRTVKAVSCGAVVMTAAAVVEHVRVSSAIAVIKKREAQLLSELEEDRYGLKRRLIEFKDQGKTEEALQLADEILNLYVNRNPDSVLAVAYNVKGICLSDLKRYEEALECTKKEVEIKRELWGGDAFELAKALYNLSVDYMNLKRYEEALPPCKEACEIKRKLSGESNEHLLSLLSNLHRLAGIYKELNRLDDALACAQECYEGKLSNLGPEDPKTKAAARLLETIQTAKNRATA